MKPRSIVFFVILAISLTYFFYEARGIIFSPYLKIIIPEQGEILHSPVIYIRGVVNAKQQVFVGGKMFIADDQGFFGGEILAYPGYNEIGVLVRGRFNKETRKVVKVMVE